MHFVQIRGTCGAKIEVQFLYCLREFHGGAPCATLRDGDGDGDGDGEGVQMPDAGDLRHLEPVS